MKPNFPGYPMWRRRGVVVAVAVACVLGLTGVAAAAIGLSTSGSDPGLQRAAVSPVVNAAVKSQLSVFNRAGTLADKLPSTFGWTLQHVYGFAGANAAASRHVTASDGEAAYLVPANDGLCAISANEAFCAPAAHLAGADSVDLCSPTLPSGQIEIEWLLPDGAQNIAVRKADGSTNAFASGYNVYLARFPASGALPTAIEWDAGGQHHAVDTGIPLGAAAEKCAHPGSAPPASKLPNIAPGVYSLSQLQKLTHDQITPEQK